MLSPPPQDGPKIPHKPPRCGEEVPGSPQEDPRCPNQASRGPQDAPRNLQNRLQEASERHPRRS
eukprot:6997118-Pyramimonas_sp.AAC.1